MNENRKSELRKTIIAALAVLAYLVLSGSQSSPAGRRLLGTTKLGLSQYIDPVSVVDRREADNLRTNTTDRPLPEEFLVCGRTAKFHQASWSLQKQYFTCPKYSKMLKLSGKGKIQYGRSGNRLRTFVNAIQYARDRRKRMGMTLGSWAQRAVNTFFMADGEDWMFRMEESLCIKILKKTPKRRSIWRRYPQYRNLFYYKSRSRHDIFVASHMHILRTLWQHYNTGLGHTGTAVNDMCSGINALFTNAGGETRVGPEDREDQRSLALYSAVHLRSLEGKGKTMLAKTCKKKGCDRRAAQEMRPEYIKSILSPLGMLGHPIVVISDNQKGSRIVLDRLLNDPDIGPLIKVVPADARWLGGDMTLAVMSNVFIGHPSSTMSGFVARSRNALGFSHNYIYLARDEHGEWSRVQ